MSKADDIAKAEAEFKAAAVALQAANAEKDAPAVDPVDDIQVASETASAKVVEVLPTAPTLPEAVLDKSRAYGTVGGEYVVGGVKVRYQQDGLNFDHLGNLVKE